MNYERIQLPLKWTTEPAPQRSPWNRKMHVSECGRVKLIPKKGNGGETLWQILIDDIDLNHTFTNLRRQKRHVSFHLARTRGYALEEKTVVWVYFSHPSLAERKRVGIRYQQFEDLDELARNELNLPPQAEPYSRIVSPRQDRLD